jgi:hypothetical protein
MDRIDRSVDPDNYRIDTNSFDTVERESSLYERVDLHIEHWNEIKEVTKFRLIGPGEKWKQRTVYTAGLHLSDQSKQTIPIFEVDIPSSQAFENVNSHNHRRSNNERSVYTTHLRTLFVKQDIHGRPVGLGPIGKCFSVSQDQSVILYLDGIDRVPGQAQSVFFEVLDRNPRIQYGIELQARPENLLIFTSTDSAKDQRDTDRKLSSLMGSVISQD